jgi:hypothetical protein
MRFWLDIPHPDEHGQMSVPQFEQLDSLDHCDEFRSRAILQAAITEAFAMLNAGARQEAIAQIKQYADLAARSNAGCYIRCLSLRRFESYLHYQVEIIRVS